MCDPVTMAALTIGTTVAGAGLQAGAQIHAANEQAAGLEARADWQRRQASVETLKANYNIQQQRLQDEQVLSEQEVGFMARGIQTGGGTPEDIAMSTIMAQEMNIQGMRFARDEEVEKLEFDAAMSEANAEGVRSAGRISALATMVTGVSDALSGTPQLQGTSLTNTAFQGAGAGAPLNLLQPIQTATHVPIPRTRPITGV